MLRRLLTVSHSYCVAQNRRLAHELALAAEDKWAVTAIAPPFFDGDLRGIHVESILGERNALELVDVHGSRSAHLFVYSRRIGALLNRSWSLVHCWEEPFVLAGAQIAALANPKTPLIFATAQNIAKTYPLPFRYLERRSIRRAAGVIAFGQTVRETLAATPEYRSKRVRFIPMGVDTEYFRPSSSMRLSVRQKLGWDDTPNVIGYLGRFVAEKGLEVLLTALETVSTSWRALFVGAGPLTSKVASWASRFGDRVRIVPGVTHDEVPAYLNAMDLLCAPSQTTSIWREQFGRMLVEAMACGIPVIGSDSGEIPFTIGNAGVVLAERDVLAWTAAIEGLLCNSRQRSDLKELGLNLAQSRYSWKVVAKRHWDFFNETLELPTEVVS